MSEQTNNIDITKVDEQIVHLMSNHREAIAAFSESPVKPEHFDRTYRPIIDCLLHCESRNASITRISFLSYLDKLNLSKKDIIAQEGLFARVKNIVGGVKLDDLSVLLEKKRSSYIDTIACAEVKNFIENRKKDGVFAAKELVEKIKLTLDEVDRTENITFNPIESDEFYDAWEKELLERRESDKPVLDCGLPEIDDVMGTGFDAETLTVICADVGSYKSTLMLNIALGVFERHDVDVLFIGLEMPKFRIFDKIVSRKSGVPFKKLIKPKQMGLTDEEVELLRAARSEWKEKNKNRFVLLEFGSRTTVQTIRRQIEKHLYHHKPRLVVIDYIANLNPDKSRDGRNDLEIGDMLKDLLKMGKPGSVSKEGFAVLTGAQLGRDAIKKLRNQRDQGKLALGSEDIQGSHQYSADATSIFGLYKNPADKTQIHVFPIKNRYGETTYEKTNSNKATLRVRPEISKIWSESNSTWESNAVEDLFKKGSEVPTMPSDNFDADWGDDPAMEEVAVSSTSGGIDDIDSFLSQ